MNQGVNERKRERERERLTEIVREREPRSLTNQLTDSFDIFNFPIREIFRISGECMVCEV